MSSKTIYSFPEPKEPEKTTSWDKPSAPLFRDAELEKAERRTKLIKERMSPRDTLGLPALLEAHRWKYGITDAFFKSQASFDRIYVFPIDPFDGDDVIPGTSIHRPKLTKMKDMQEGHRGVLISAGLTAMDRLMSHGIELGHIVTTNKNVPFARRCEDLEGDMMFYLVMRDADLAGSETLADHLRAKSKRLVDVGGPSGYLHQVATVQADGTLDISKKQSVYVNDNW